GIRDFHVTGVQTCALPISVSDSKRRHFSGTLATAPQTALRWQRLPHLKGRTAPLGLRSGRIPTLASPFLLVQNNPDIPLPAFRMAHVGGWQLLSGTSMHPRACPSS